MVRERKPQTGATNLSARSASGKALLPVVPVAADTGGNSTASKVAVRSVAHKLLAPDLYKSTHKTNSEFDDLKITATWTPNDVYKRDFHTVYNDSFVDPKEVDNQTGRHGTMSTLEIAKQTVKRRDEVDSINNMCKLVRASYGTVASMLRSVSTTSLTSYPLFSL
jgi:hypothetical protein